MSEHNSTLDIPQDEPVRSVPLKVWIKTARPVTLTAAVSPVLVGSALAAYNGTFKPLLFLITLLSCLFLQIGTNFFNEYFDYLYGLDSLESLGASTVIFRKEMSAKQVLGGGIGSFVIAALLGISLIFLVGPAIILFGLAGAAIAYFYSARPFKLASRGLGDVMVFLAMGVLMTWGSYYVQIQQWSWSAFAASIPVGFLVTAILNMNNVRDYQEDLAVNKLTLPVRFGLRFGQGFHAFLVLGSFVALVLGVIVHLLPLLSLLALLILPVAIVNVRSVWRATDRQPFIKGTKTTAILHLQFGLAFTIGILLSTLLHL